MAECVVHHAIAERRSRDKPALRPMNEEAGVSTRAVGVVEQFILEGQEILFQPVLERSDRACPRLPRAASCQARSRLDQQHRCANEVIYRRVQPVLP